jgi:soluble lytic murein transglycosylase-like protein
MIEISVYHEKIIKESAAAFGLSAAMVAAICMKESAFDADAMRFEANYRWLWRVGENAAKLKITFRTEEQLQCFSYGLMQVMGANARSCAFEGPLPHLLDPTKNLRYGCQHLRSLYDRFAKTKPTNQWDEAIVAAYNLGSPRRAGPKRWINELYVRGVEKFYQELCAKGWR